MTRTTANAWADLFTSMGMPVVLVVLVSKDPDLFALETAHGRLATEHDCAMFEAGFHIGRDVERRSHPVLSR